ncbi:hypothetical protein RBTH_09391 [Bacillus thuringiensis serovar israelensis ATCC 35646]|nr:hypothetical protein RBTH_09391 [Bacillus thuringiensis serovar israelensis ATCC 35646]
MDVIRSTDSPVGLEIESINSEKTGGEFMEHNIFGERDYYRRLSNIKCGPRDYFCRACIFSGGNKA